MTEQTVLEEPDFANAISPWEEMHSYETMYGAPSVTLKRIAELYSECPALPSSLLERLSKELVFDIEKLRKDVDAFLNAVLDKLQFSISIHGTYHYPKRLREAKNPLEVFYYRGDVGLLESPSVSVVGSRKCSPDGAKRAARIARELVANNYTVVSGLAEGIDTAAMTSAIESGGRTIGVIGTPLDAVYPAKNANLQDQVAKDYLLISQVPFFRYHHEPFRNRRFYFPQRNETMAALSVATVIVEASETSGTHTQARACMQQRRKLFILESCFNSGQAWPHTYEKQGAIRVRSIDDVLSVLGSANGGQSEMAAIQPV